MSCRHFGGISLVSGDRRPAVAIYSCLNSPVQRLLCTTHGDAKGCEARTKYIKTIDDASSRFPTPVHIYITILFKCPKYTVEEAQRTSTFELERKKKLRYINMGDTYYIRGKASASGMLSPRLSQHNSTTSPLVCRIVAFVPNIPGSASNQESLDLILRG